MMDLPGPDRLAPGTVEAWRQHLAEEVDPEALRRDLSEGTLPQAFHEVAARYPVRVALTIGGESVAYGELDRLAAKAGGWFQAQGVEPGQPAVLCATNSLDHERLVEREGEADFSSLRLAVSGSAALSPALARRVSELLQLDVLERYGSTESGLSVSNPYDGLRKPGSVGIPLPGTELSVVDGEGRCLAPGEDGEIVLRGPQVFSAYLDLPEATHEAFYPGGWFRTGDIGRVDPEDGYLTITGRSKELIISGGLNVYPREVELALERYPTVEKAVVVGAPSERWGEEVVAFVVPEGEAIDPESLAAHMREHLSAYKCPKRFIEIEELPRNEMGKVQREELVRTVSEEARAGPW